MMFLPPCSFHPKLTQPKAASQSEFSVFGKSRGRLRSKRKEVRVRVDHCLNTILQTPSRQKAQAHSPNVRVVSLLEAWGKSLLSTEGVPGTWERGWGRAARSKRDRVWSQERWKRRLLDRHQGVQKDTDRLR